MIHLYPNPMIEYTPPTELELSFIESLAFPPLETGPISTAEATSIDVGSLPKGIIAGGNLVAFGEATSFELREDVALNLLFAQESAKADPVSTTPDLWMERHHMALKTSGSPLKLSPQAPLFLQRPVQNWKRAFSIESTG